MRGGCVVTLLKAKAVNTDQGQQSTQAHKPSQAVAGCGESRTHGGKEGEGKTPCGCASCPYPLRTGGQQRVAALRFRQRLEVGLPPPLSGGVGLPCMSGGGCVCVSSEGAMHEW